MPLESKTVYTIVTIGFVTIAVSSLIFYRNRKKKQQNLPYNAKWELIGSVKEISIYPVRSGGALLLQNAKCDKFGLTCQGLRDRCLVLFNNNGDLAFSGTYPTMLSISSEIKDNATLIIRAPNKESLEFNLDLLVQGKSIIERKSEGMQMRLIECDSSHHEWFSDVILQRSEGLKLFVSLEPNINLNIWGEDKSSFNPLMVMNQKSVDDLNQRLLDSTKVHHLQFRGNLLLECYDSVNAYDEDNWDWLKIGDTDENSSILHYRAPCLRCISPNVDIKTCKHSPRFEPLKTLKMYRLVHNNKEPTMGAYFEVHREGFIQLNDPVFALRKQ